MKKMILLVLLLAGCATGSPVPHGQQDDRTFTVDVESQHWNADEVRVYCADNGRYMGSIRGVGMEPVSKKKFRLGSCGSVYVVVTTLTDNGTWRSIGGSVYGGRVLNVFIAHALYLSTIR